MEFKESRRSDWRNNEYGHVLECDQGWTRLYATDSFQVRLLRHSFLSLKQLPTTRSGDLRNDAVDEWILLFVKKC